MTAEIVPHPRSAAPVTAPPPRARYVRFLCGCGVTAHLIGWETLPDPPLCLCCHVERLGWPGAEEEGRVPRTRLPRRKGAQAAP